jgi:hypothetical protein
VRFAGLDHDEGTIRRAIELSTFEHLRDQEAARGFREKARKASSFFRRGEVDQWKEALTPEQVRRLAACHGEVMRELGYLDGDGSRLWGRTQESLIRSR